MKTFRTTWLMTLLVIGIAAYTIYDYRRTANDPGLAENERLAFTLTPDQPTQIKIIKPEETIFLNKEGENWEMTEPVKDLGDTPSIQGYIYSLLAQRVRTFRLDEDAKTAPDWKEAGLDKPAVTIEVSGAGKTETISLGSKNAFDGSFYVREKDELLLGDTAFAQLRDRTANSFRSRKLWRETKVPERAELNSQGVKFTLLKKDGQWTLEPKPDYELDPEKIQEWFDRVREFQANYIEKDGINKEDTEKYLLRKPSFIAKLGDDWILTAGQDRAEDVFLYTNKRDTLYKTSVSAMSDIAVKPSYFRDGRKGFAFPLEQVRRIELTSGKKEHVIVKNGSDWSLDGAESKDHELDTVKLATFLQNARSLSGKEFYEKGQGFPEKPQIAMLDKDGQPVFQLWWGSLIKGTNDVYAKTNLEKQVMSLSKEKIDELTPGELVRKKE
jgi:hypothetical protein